MALGPAVTLTAAILLQTDECKTTDTVAGDDVEYVRLVNLYRDGHRKDAVSELRNRDAADVDRLIRRDAPGMTDSCLEAATLLETELGIDLAQRSRWQEADRNFDEAWRISFLVEPPQKRLRFQRDWLLAAGLFHHQLIFVNLAEEAFPRAAGFLRKAVRLYPNDPEVLLAAGSILEWSGSLRAGDPDHLKEAEELYSRARRLAPADPEILLHHGWVLEKLKREDEAAAPLLRVSGASGEGGRRLQKSNGPRWNGRAGRPARGSDWPLRSRHDGHPRVAGRLSRPRACPALVGRARPGA